MHSPTDRDAPDEHERGWTATVDCETLLLESSALLGDLASSPACREAAVNVLAERDVESVVVRRRVLEYRYDDYSVALLLAAGRFVDRLSGRDDQLAARAKRDPLGAAREATARGAPLSNAAAESGLALLAAAVDDYDDAFRATVGFVDAVDTGRDRRRRRSTHRQPSPR